MGPEARDLVALAFTFLPFAVLSLAVVAALLLRVRDAAGAGHVAGGKRAPEAADEPARSRTATLEALPGRAYLVGAGLGDPSMLTMQAHGIVTTADVVLFDRLISDEVRALAKESARVYVAGPKTAATADRSQAELDRIGIEAVKEGLSVARVKIGDPLVFARGGEELSAYRSEGVEPVLIPGVTSALAAPLLAGIPLTHRGIASDVLVTTGRDRGGGFPDIPFYSPSRTLVLLMAVGRLPSLYADHLKPLAYPPEVPVAVLERAGLPGQRFTATRLGEVAKDHERLRFKAPAVVVVGWVASMMEESS